MAYPKISEHFLIPELVPPEIWNAWGEKSIWFIDRRIVNAAEKIRTYFNVPMFINTWHWGGQYKERGFRSFGTTTGAQFSQHKFGRAIDFSFTNIKSDEVFEVITKKWADFGITTIEQGTRGWNHVDVRDTGLDHLFEVPFS